MTDVIKKKAGRPVGSGKLSDEERKKRITARSKANHKKKRTLRIKQKEDILAEKKRIDEYNAEEIKHALAWFYSEESRLAMEKLHDEKNEKIREALLWFKKNRVNFI
jgi:hypothetical protein